MKFGAWYNAFCPLPDMTANEKNAIAPNAEKYVFLFTAKRILRRPLLGPVLFGLAVGGVPIGLALAIWFNRIMDSTENDAIAAVLVLLSISIAGISAALGGSRRWSVLFYRAFLASVALCIPIPLAVDLLLLWKSGTEVFFVANFPFHAALCVAWSIASTLGGTLFGLCCTPSEP